jgi:hypothetical protein
MSKPQYRLISSSIVGPCWQYRGKGNIRFLDNSYRFCSASGSKIRNTLDLTFS